VSHDSLLPAAWEVPQIFRDRLGRSVGRQRLMEAEGHLLLILHAPPGPEDTRREGRFFWRHPEGQWRSTEAGSGIAALERHLNEFNERIGELDAQEEKAHTAEEYFDVIYRLSPILRAVRNLHGVLQEARQASGHDRDIISLRDQAYELERTAELLQADAKNALDFYIARRSEELAGSGHRMATAAHRLNVLAAFFFPVAALTAIFGMNLRSGLEEFPPPLPFYGVLGVGVVLGAVLTALVTRRPPGPN